MVTKEVITVDTILELAQQLSASDQLRLVARLTDALANQQAVPIQPEAKKGQEQPKFTIRGLLADLGPAPSAEDIDEVRREMWANFPRDDIA
jgi:hypothetical protein